METGVTIEEPMETAVEEPEKLDLRSLDVAEEKRAELLRLFPEARTEGGKIDFDRLKLALGETVDTGRERYGMIWPGKADCFKTIQTPSVATLLPDSEQSVNFDTTQNLIIEGDNLEVLKLLQKSYLGKVKMIYIDPPYNTGNDFIYPDNYSESLQTYLEYTGQVDAEGKKFSTNPETDGRFHSKWLNMMYPRLYLARNLLREDGSVFISIDDNEVENCRRICDEVFGEENFVAQMVWQKSKKGDAKLIAKTHEYVLVYARRLSAVVAAGLWRRKKSGADDVLAYYSSLVEELKGDHERISETMRRWYASMAKDDPRRAHSHYKFSDSRGLYFADNFAGPDDGRESRPRYDILHPITGKACKKPSTGWRWDEERTRAALAEDPPLIHFGPDEATIPCRKSYLERIDTEPLSSVFYRDGRAGTLEMEALVGKGLVEFPKDVDTIREFAQVAAGTDSLIMDFFAGSGTTAQAVLELNAADGGRRKFIAVQLPEPTGHGDLKTIADITKKRVRRVIERLDQADVGKLNFEGGQKQDRGFRVFTLAESSFKLWNADAPKTAENVAAQLELHVDHVRPGRSQEDLLFEILLKSGYPLTTKVEKITMEGKQIFSAADGALLVCLEKELTLETIRDVAARMPERVVCLDEAFRGNDQLKANAVQIFKSLHRRNGEGESSSDVTVFRTV
jgi:adenine-specific DNA-methyltransferase